MQHRRMHRLIRNIASAALALTALSACAQMQPVEGQVLEQGTDKPIEGAIVVARWKGDGYHGTICFHVESTVSDENGYYYISPPETTSPHADLPDQWVNATAHKEGYVRAKRSPLDVNYLVPFAGDASERMAYLKVMIGATSCVSAGDSRKNLYAIRRALYEEANAIAETEEERKTVEWLLRRSEGL